MSIRLKPPRSIIRSSQREVCDDSPLHEIWWVNEVHLENTPPVNAQPVLTNQRVMIGWCFSKDARYSKGRLSNWRFDNKNSRIFLVRSASWPRITFTTVGQLTGKDTSLKMNATEILQNDSPEKKKSWEIYPYESIGNLNNLGVDKLTFPAWSHSCTFTHALMPALKEILGEIWPFNWGQRSLFSCHFLTRCI